MYSGNVFKACLLNLFHPIKSVLLSRDFIEEGGNFSRSAVCVCVSFGPQWLSYSRLKLTGSHFNRAQAHHCITLGNKIHSFNFFLCIYNIIFKVLLPRRHRIEKLQGHGPATDANGVRLPAFGPRAAFLWQLSVLGY